MNTLGERIIIVGSGGSGKSTFAVKLHKKTQLPLIHLDVEFWNEGWVETHDDEWREKQERLVLAEKWIIDGNFGGSISIRLKRATTAIFLDFNRLVCVYRIFKRWWQYRKKSRPDMHEGCPEKVDLKFAKWVWNYNKKSRPKMLERLQKQDNLQLIILKSKRQVKKFLEEIEIGA